MNGKKYKGILCFRWDIAAELDGDVCQLNALLRHLMVGQILIQNLNRAGALCFDVLPDDKINNALPDKRKIGRGNVVNNYVDFSGM